MSSVKLTDEDVIEMFHGMVFGVQRARSVIREESGLSDAMLIELHPWLFGLKCVLPTLVKVSDDLDAGGSVDGLTVFNLVRVLERWAPAALMSAGEHRIPEADMAWVSQGPWKGPSKRSKVPGGLKSKVSDKS